MVEKYPITQKGFDALEAELKDLKTVQRPDVIEAIAEARAHGDLSENAEYHAAREKQSFIEGRIKELEAAVGLSDVIDTSKLSGEKIIFGAHVVLFDEDTEKEISYQIVGEYEADINKNLLSIQAPISRALIGKEEGDSVTVKTPSGEKNYEVVEVAFR